MTAKTLDRVHAYQVWDKIMKIDVEQVPVVSNERLFMKEFAAPVRTLLKSFGLTNKDVSVVCPNYSMASMIQIGIPHADSSIKFEGRFRDQSQFLQDAYHNESRFDRDTRAQACRKMYQIINKAFPACGDRSDAMTDYFDARFSCY